MLKKYAKRFSRSVMGGLGPGAKAAGHCDDGGGRAINATSATILGHNTINEEDPVSDVYRWPPHSRKVIDDEIGEEKERSPLNARGCQRKHLSSCSSNATTATYSTGEEGFGSESSLEELRMLSVMRPTGVRHNGGSRLADDEGDGLKAAAKSSSLSSLASSASEGLSDMVSHLRCTLFYYALVLRFVL